MVKPCLSFYHSKTLILSHLNFICIAFHATFFSIKTIVVFEALGLHDIWGQWLVMCKNDLSKIMLHVLISLLSLFRCVPFGNLMNFYNLEHCSRPLGCELTNESPIIG